MSDVERLLAEDGVTITDDAHKIGVWIPAWAYHEIRRRGPAVNRLPAYEAAVDSLTVLVEQSDYEAGTVAAAVVEEARGVLDRLREKVPA